MTLLCTPNQGELVSCDQNGSVKVWDLGQNGCSHELVPEEGCQLGQLTVAADGSCLVAGTYGAKCTFWRFINGSYEAQHQVVGWSTWARTKCRVGARREEHQRGTLQSCNR